MIASSSTDRTVDLGSLGPVGRSVAEIRFFHLATVFGLIPWRRARTLRALLTILYRSTDCLSRAGASVEYLAHSASFHPAEKIAPSNSGTKHIGDLGSQKPAYCILCRLTLGLQNCLSIELSHVSNTTGYKFGRSNVGAVNDWPFNFASSCLSDPFSFCNILSYPHDRDCARSSKYEFIGLTVHRGVIYPQLIRDRRKIGHSNFSIYYRVIRVSFGYYIFANRGKMSEINFHLIQISQNNRLTDINKIRI